MMKSLPFPASKNTAFGILLGLTLSSALAFKVLYDLPGCAISIDKQNVFYIGVDNPVSIVVRGVPVEQVILQAQGITLTKVEGDRYTVRATVPGEATITVSGGSMKPTVFKYRVKRIPDPVLRLGGTKRSSVLGNGEFKAQSGIAAVLENFDFDAVCEVVGYEVTYLAKRQDPVTLYNTGAKFNGSVQDYISRAKPGDAYFFDEVKVKCPGDASARNLGSLVFRIK